MPSVLESIGKTIARFLSRPRHGHASIPTVSGERLSATLRKGDVLLVDGNSRIAEAVKYLTQSTWSHAALYVGDALVASGDVRDPPVLIEADVLEGVHAVPLSSYWGMHTRICRPVGLSASEVEAVIGFAVRRLGHHYDLRNILDLARYLIQKPPVPARYRRRLVALGSGDPTRAICSSLIAQAFQSIRYPILPYVDANESSACVDRNCYDDLLEIRHHSLFAPKDFDISPYFRIVKPTLTGAFDHRSIRWTGGVLLPMASDL
jgi:hypothetical protein